MQYKTKYTQINANKSTCSYRAVLCYMYVLAYTTKKFDGLHGVKGPDGWPCYVGQFYAYV